MGSRGGFGSLPRYFPPYPFRGQLPTTEPRNNQGTNQRVVVDVTKLLCSNSCFSYLVAVGQLAFQADIWPWQTVWQPRQIQFKEVQCWQLSIPSASTVFLRRDELCRCCYSFPIWKMSSLMLLIVFWKILSKSLKASKLKQMHRSVGDLGTHQQRFGNTWNVTRCLQMCKTRVLLWVHLIFFPSFLFIPHWTLRHWVHRCRLFLNSRKQQCDLPQNFCHFSLGVYSIHSMQ